MTQKSARGATTTLKNTKEEILQETKALLLEMIEANDIKIDDIISVFFTMTKDLTKVYPAVAAREIGITSASLMCYSELFVEDSLPMCIRIMINFETEMKQSDVRHIYLKEAKKLRPDLITKAIAIDGPSGAGKSTIAKKLAETLGFMYVDTGAMYRAVAFYCIENGIDTLDEASVIKHLDDIAIDLKIIDGTQNVFLNGQNVSDKIRTQKVSKHTSQVAAIREVRARLVKLQRVIAKNNNVVVDGRDIGTVVLPDADLKIFLTASIEARTLRRMKDLERLGNTPDFELLKKEIAARDERDENREVDPLRQADDAILLDSSNMTAEEVVNFIAKKI